MPLFEYVCEECGSTFEKLVRSSTTVIQCPDCATEHVRKKISTFASKIAGGGAAASSSASTGAACAPTGL